MRAVGGSTLNELKLPQLTIRPTLLAAERAGHPPQSSGYPPSGSTRGRAVFGLTPPRNEKAPIRRGQPIALQGLREIRSEVIPVSATEIRAIAKLPSEVLHSLARLVEHPSELLAAALAYSKEGREFAEVRHIVSEVHSDVGRAATDAIHTLVSHAADRLKDKIKDSILTAMVGEDTAAALTELANVAQLAYTAAAIAKVVAEAQDFEQHYTRALNNPKGKNFLLDVQSTLEPTPAVMPVATPGRGPASPGVSVRVGGASATAEFSPGGARFPVTKQSRPLQERPAPTMSGPFVLKENLGLHAFIYWWVGK